MTTLQKCFDCGISSTEIHNHHVVPKSLGGTSTVPLCPACHGKVHGMDFTNHAALTKKGIDAARARGVKLGNPRLSEAGGGNTSKAHAASVANGQQRRKEQREVISRIMGDLSLREIAQKLNDSGYRTSRGSLWKAASVQRVLDSHG